MANNGINIGLKSYDDLFKTDEGRKTEEIKPIPLSELKPFSEQPFKVLENEDMEQLVESVKENGVLSPIVARPHPEGGYEILSGHRRAKACEIAGITEIPVVVKDLDDDTAIILLVDSNLQREHILPSEKAFAYQMKLEAMKRKAGRPSVENVGQIVPNLLGKRSTEIVGEENGESYKQVQRYEDKASVLREKLDVKATTESEISLFADRISKCLELKAMNKFLARELIESITVSAYYKVDGETMQDVTINYKFVGNLKNLEMDFLKNAI